MLENEPDYTPENFKVWPFRNEAQREHWVEALREAGVPDWGNRPGLFVARSRRRAAYRRMSALPPEADIAVTIANFRL